MNSETMLDELTEKAIDIVAEELAVQLDTKTADRVRAVVDDSLFGFQEDLKGKLSASAAEQGEVFTKLHDTLGELGRRAHESEKLTEELRRDLLAIPRQVVEQFIEVEKRTSASIREVNDAIGATRKGVAELAEALSVQAKTLDTLNGTVAQQLSDIRTASSAVVARTETFNSDLVTFRKNQSRMNVVIVVMLIVVFIGIVLGIFL